MMNNQQYLLGKLAEEASEIAQIALKAQQFGGDEVMPGQPLTNFERTHEELNDLLGIILMLNNECGFDYDHDFSAAARKIDRVKHFREYSISLGLVRGGES